MKSIGETKTYKDALDRVVSEFDNVSDLDAITGKTIFIAGATGQIGSAVLELLNELSKRFSLDLILLAGARDRKKYEHHFSTEVKNRVQYFEYDALKSFCSTKEIDYYICCAGYGDPNSFGSDPVGVLNSNYQGLNGILSYCAKKQHGKVLFVSSGEVYGQPDPCQNIFFEYEVSKINSLIPRSCYPIAKISAEALCVAYEKQYGVDVVIARQSHVFGPGYSNKDSRVTAQFFNDALAKRDICMKSLGVQKRSYIFELDAAAAYVYLLLKGISGEAYNVSSSHETSIKDLANIIAETAEVRVVLETSQKDSQKENYGNISHSILSNSKLSALGWKECFSPNEAINYTVKTLMESRL